jgi:hypothetical protein
MMNSKFIFICPKYRAQRRQFSDLFGEDIITHVCIIYEVQKRSPRSSTRGMDDLLQYPIRQHRILLGTFSWTDIAACMRMFHGTARGTYSLVREHGGTPVVEL